MNIRSLVLALGLLALPQSVYAAVLDTGPLARHRAFVGWSDGDGTFKSWHLTATRKRTRKNPDGTTESVVSARLDEVRRGALYRDSYTRAGGLMTDEGFTGRMFWDADENGNTVTHFETQVRYDFAENAVFYDAVSMLSGASRGTAKIGDDTVDIVRVVPTPGFPVDLYVDATGAYRRAVVNPDVNSRVTINIDKYIEAIPGKKVIGSFRYGSGNAYEVESVEANVSVSDEQLHPPRPRSTWTFDPTDSVSIEVRQHTSPYGSSGRSVTVHATINGHEGIFLLDSGASGSIVFSPYADTLGLTAISSNEYSGVNGGNVRSSYVKLNELAVGRNVLHDVIIDKSEGKSFEGIDGILGFDVLANALVDVDLVAKRLTIKDPAHFAPTVGKGAVAFPVDLATRQPAIHITVGNGIDMKPIFDTGDDFLVLLSDDINSRLAPMITSQVYFGGVDGSAPAPAPCARLSQLLVGPYRYENSVVCFASSRVFGSDGGLLGFDFLQHFNWTFDYPEGKFVLTPNGVN